MKWKHNRNHIFLNRLIYNVEKCVLCDEHNGKACAFISTNKRKVDVIYVAQNPSSVLYNKNEPAGKFIPFGLDGYHHLYDFFFIKTNNLISRKLNKENIEFYVTNIVKCSTKNDKLENKKMIENCVKRFLIKELLYFKHYNPNVIIITLGVAAREAFKTYLSEEKYISMYHPSFLKRKSKEFVDNYIKEALSEK